MRSLAQPLLVSSLTLASALAQGAASDALPAMGGEAAPRSRVEPEPQLERMEALARQLAPGTEAVWLETNSDRTLTLYYPAAQPEPHGALILLPDANHHPDWPTDLHPLRTGLADQGWDTLAVSLPRPPRPSVPERTAPATSASAATGSSLTAGAADTMETPLESYGERVMKICEAAMRHLESRGRSYLILLGSGSGAGWAARCAGEFQQQRELGLVLLDARPDDSPGAPDLTTLLPQLTLPVLDLYRPPATGAPIGEQARLRARTASRDALENYHQSRLPAHMPDSDWLVREVRGRIERYLMPTEAPEETAPKPTADQRPGG
ncbi:hypothetical protein GCM10011348_37100 [Marinobacterium nitratireducens]|uniref:DUF3530 domain-containing protein n=1 Tax=Marinobacterium nitratireducens TaxID=518897 RepID=A0A917ZNZ0_9GAMM|nr:DUF3530 family protein [Marinobacterium nitratireducens]GGO86377.1 hypothetical protein GCM10011348_37100 [Marinobacterium nitratireducens]